MGSIEISIFRVNMLKAEAIKIKKRLSWSQQFRCHLYRSNFKQISLQQPNSQQFSCQSNSIEFSQQNSYNEQLVNNAAEFSLLTLRCFADRYIEKEETTQSRQQGNIGYHLNKNFEIDQTGEIQTNHPDRTQVSQNSAFNKHSVYIPTLKNLQSDNEFKNTFSYIRHLYELNMHTEINLLYESLQQSMSRCKEIDKKQDGKHPQCLKMLWLVCKKKLIPSLDVVAAVSFYLQFVKFGYHQLMNKIREIYGDAYEHIVIYKILQASKYFSFPNRSNRTLSVSVQFSDSLDMVSMSKTMKMLYCSICYTYDCGRHGVSELCSNKMYNYYSLKNKKTQQSKYESAFSLCIFQQQLGSDNQRHEQQQSKDKQSLDTAHICQSNQYRRQAFHENFCGAECYKLLSFEKMSKISVLKSILLSPIDTSLINIGLQIFGFDPCLMKVLFDSSAAHCKHITCSIIYSYLIQQKNLKMILEYKMNQSEQVHLLNEPSYFTRQPIPILLPEQSYLKLSSNPINKRKKSNPRRKRKIHEESNDQLKFQCNTICFHHFIGEDEPQVASCKDCECALRGFCLPECQCWPQCQIMILGCFCKSKEDCKSMKCPCYKNKNQCIPGVCENCFDAKSESSKTNTCANNQILIEKRKLIRIGPSKIAGAGLGAFAGEDIKKNQLVTIYNGQIIEQDLQIIRQTIKESEDFYNFGSCEGSIDARFIGNKSRFINHGSEKMGQTNIQSRNIYTMSQQFIALYAQRDIRKGEELLFDYDAEQVNQRNQDMNFLKGHN